MLASRELGRSSAAENRPYRIVEVPSGGHRNVSARAINDAGFVVGHIDDSAFVYDGSETTMYPPIRFSYYGVTYESVANAINDAGIAAGFDGSETPIVMSGLVITTATTFSHAKTRFLDRSVAGTFEADAIDDRGDLAGERKYRGFFRSHDGTYLEVKPLSTRDENNGSRASALDDFNHVVGGTTIDVVNVPSVVVAYGMRVGRPRGPIMGPDLNAYVIHGFLGTIRHHSIHMIDLGALFRFPDTYATALNAKLTVVGYSGTKSSPKLTRIGGPSHAWMWQRGHMTDLGNADGSSFAYSINDAGTIVGASDGRAVRWKDGVSEDLNALVPSGSGWKLQCARGINRRGLIVGDGEKDGRPAMFELVPVR